MFRPMFLLSLLAALAGTPLRQSEAADDLARSLAGLIAGGEFETVDGGVGDDSGDTIQSAAARAPVGDSVADPLPLPLVNAPLCPVPCLLSRGASFHVPPANPTRLRAWLQCFLF